MEPTLNRSIMTFFDLYEFWDNDPKAENAPTDSRPGFKQQWETSPFHAKEIPTEDVEGAYNRLLARYFTTPFGMLNERQIHLNVFRLIRDFLPNLRRRITTLDEIYAQDMRTLQMKQSREGQNQSSGTGNVTDTGFENQAVAPNTAGSPEQPILDTVAAQRNRNLKQASTDNRTGTNNETVMGDLSTAYQVKLTAIVDGLWDEFIKRFDSLFVYLYSGVYDYSYRNPLNSEEGGS